MVAFILSDFEFTQPLQISDSTEEDECEVLVSGANADCLFGVSAHNFLFSAEVQEKVMQQLRNIENNRVEISVVAVENSHKREFHLIDSYIIENEENYL